MDNAMVDSETLGVRPGSILLSLGATMFCPKTGQLGVDFYVNIDTQSCRDVGLTEDQSTVDWWKDQSKEARAILLPDRVPLREALERFSIWWIKAAAQFFWSNGAAFDAVLLESAYRACGMEPPWQFWNVRCCRTILALGNRKPDRKGLIPHYSLHDAQSQARAVAATLRTGIKL